MENQKIKLEDIETIGIELLRKNNSNFYRSNLSPAMKKIFLAANKIYGITNIEDEYYMKSGAIPNRIYYIYSDQLNKLAKDKFYDIVLFNGKPCVWIYSKNAIDLIGEHPTNYIHGLYYLLLDMFIYENEKKLILTGSFLYIEQNTILYVMTIRLVKFLSDNYGLIDLEKCIVSIQDEMSRLYNYTDSSTKDFINNIIKNYDYDNYNYYSNREYLDSYMLLEKNNIVFDEEE